MVNMGHLKKIEQSWFQHFKKTWKAIDITIKLILKLIIHSFFPNIFQNIDPSEVIKKPKPTKTPKPIEVTPEPTPKPQEKRVLVYASRNS